MTESIETYRIDPGYLGVVKIVTGISMIGVIFAVYLGAAEYVVIRSIGGSPWSVVIFSLVLVAVFGTLSALGVRFVMHAPKESIFVDIDGIWPAETDKTDGLISWEQMHAATPLFFRRSVVVTDASGKPLIAVSRYLFGFERVLKTITSHIEENLRDKDQPQLYSRKLTYHVIYGTAFFLVMTAGAYLSFRTRWMAPVALILFLILIRDYLSTPHAIILEKEGMRIENPVIKYMFSYRDIVSVELLDSDGHNVAAPRVVLSVKTYGKPFVIQDVAEGTADLFYAIKLRTGPAHPDKEDLLELPSS